MSPGTGSQQSGGQAKFEWNNGVCKPKRWVKSLRLGRFKAVKTMAYRPNCRA